MLYGEKNRATEGAVRGRKDALRRQNSEASHQAIMDESDINSVLFLFLQAMNFIVPTTVLALADEVIE